MQNICMFSIKELFKLFSLVQVGSKSVGKFESYRSFKVLQQAVMDATIVEALWRRTYSRWADRDIGTIQAKHPPMIFAKKTSLDKDWGDVSEW